MEINHIYQGDTLEVLKTFPDESVDCIITSPPYYGLRDYGTARWEGGDPKCDHQVGRNTRKSNKWMEDKLVEGTFGDEAIKNGELCPKCGAKRIDLQLGLEKTLDEYFSKMLLITSELKRVLKKTGTMWWNHGDSYSANRSYQVDGTKQIKGSQPRRRSVAEFAEKCMLLQNYRLVLKMIDEQGWILRNQIIWHKPNCMPSSVKDRFTVDFEPVFFLTKSKKYWFKPQYEKQIDWGTRDRNEGKFKKAGLANGLEGNLNPLGRNKRCVWRVNTSPFKDAHFATFPPKLIEPMVKAGCPEFICQKCGKAREGIYEPSEEYKRLLGKSIHDHKKGYTDCGCRLLTCHKCGIVIELWYETKANKMQAVWDIMPSEGQMVSEDDILRKKMQFNLDSPAQTGCGLQNKNSKRIYPDLATTNSDLFNGTSSSDGEGVRKETNAIRSSQSYKRDKERQLSREFGSNGQENSRQITKATHKTNQMPSLRKNVKGVWSCPKCGSPLEEKQHPTRPGIILDCFMGSGTTAMVAKKLGRKYIGIELNPDYIEIAEKRLAQEVLL